MAGILSEACTDGALRAMVIDAADVLKKQEKLIEMIGEKRAVSASPHSKLQPPLRSILE